LVGPVVTGVVMDCFGKPAMPASGIAACGLVLAVWILLRERPASANAPSRCLYHGPRNAA
ncbi:MAG TPA: hypothetical protein VH682_22265, partial [Gemmataceae bacterium]